MKRLIAPIVALGVIAAPAAAATKANAGQTTQNAKTLKKNAKLAKKSAAHANAAQKTN
jgi:Ni/Co efflux regulator RcnB